VQRAQSVRVAVENIVGFGHVRIQGA
jgi:hypothetical protein